MKNGTKTQFVTFYGFICSGRRVFFLSRALNNAENVFLHSTTWPPTAQTTLILIFHGHSDILHRGNGNHSIFHVVSELFRNFISPIFHTTPAQQTTKVAVTRTHTQTHTDTHTHADTYTPQTHMHRNTHTNKQTHLEDERQFLDVVPVSLHIWGRMN